MTSPSDGSPNTVFAAMFLRARMTSPSDGSPNTVFAAMFLRARMTSPSDGSPNTVFAAMFLRARMTSPSDGSPNTVFAATFLRARMTLPSDGPLFTSGIYTTRTLSASQYPLLLSPVPSMEAITSNKGGQKLCLDGFMYIKQWQRRNIRWRCAQRSKFGCKGALGTTLDLQNPHVLHDHNHNPDPHSTAAAKCHVQMV